jgi:hypothetical protein
LRVSSGASPDASSVAFDTPLGASLRFVGRFLERFFGGLVQVSGDRPHSRSTQHLEPSGTGTEDLQAPGAVRHRGPTGTADLQAQRTFRHSGPSGTEDLQHQGRQALWTFRQGRQAPRTFSTRAVRHCGPSGRAVRHRGPSAPGPSGTEDLQHQDLQALWTFRQQGRQALWTFRQGRQAPRTFSTRAVRHRGPSAPGPSGTVDLQAGPSGTEDLQAAGGPSSGITDLQAPSIQAA